MMNGVGADLHATDEHGFDLLPVDITGPTNFTGDNVEHAAKAMRLQEGISESIRIIVAIIKGQDNGMLWQWPAVVQGIKELIKGNRVIPLLLEIIQLLLETGWRDCKAHTQLCLGDNVGDMVIHQNRHVDGS